MIPLYHIFNVDLSIENNFILFTECYKLLNNQLSLSTTTALGKSLKKMTQIGCLVACKLDTDSEAEDETNLDPSKP